MSIEQVGNNLLPAIAYGDAAGLPVETKSATWIAKRYGWIDSLVDPEENPFYRGRWSAGTTSDDTQLSEMVAQSLMQAGGFSLESLAEAHIAGYRDVTKIVGEKSVTRGWGGSTTRSIERVIAGMSPEQSGELDGAGNGITMKQAPLAFWQAVAGTQYEERIRQYDLLTNMTHDSDVARACTRLHGEVLHMLMGNFGIPAEEFRALASEILATEQESDVNGWINRALTEPAGSFQELVERYAGGKGGYKYGFFVPETVAIVYDIFGLAKGDYNTAVFYAVNLGGDADSTASMVGAMCSMWSGGKFERPNDFDKTLDSARLAKVSKEFVKKALEAA